MWQLQLDFHELPYNTFSNLTDSCYKISFQIFESHMFCWTKLLKLEYNNFLMSICNECKTIRSIQLETELIRPDNMFPVINSQYRCWRAQARHKALCRAQQRYTRVPLALKARIDDVLLNGSLADICWWPKHWNLQQFCRRVVLLSRWTILFSRHWYHSCKIFFWAQRCRRFDVLPDSRYSRCIQKWSYWKIPTHHYLGGAESHLSCPTIKPCWNSLKSW